MFIKLRKTLEAEGIGLLLVSVDDPDSQPAALSFLKEHHARLPSYAAKGSLALFKMALNPRWPGMIPATFLYDASGKLHYFWGGPVYENELMPIVNGFLAGKAIDGESTFGLAPGATTSR